MWFLIGRRLLFISYPGERRALTARALENGDRRSKLDVMEHDLGMCVMILPCEKAIANCQIKKSGLGLSAHKLDHLMYSTA